MKNIVLVFLLSLLLTETTAAVRLPSIIGSHMVLQQNVKVKIWGWSAPAEKITIQVSWDTATYSVTASRGARWIVAREGSFGCFVEIE